MRGSKRAFEVRRKIALKFKDLGMWKTRIGRQEKEGKDVREEEPILPPKKNNNSTIKI